ncbi:hypothetical protein CsSME_00017089 [Camellia sinensis var. sinensis]
MKILAKPMSSPSRTDKFPPPLMRFLRSNVGSKSRGKSRSSPMFMRRKNYTTTTSMIETTQEPSSPKVTCIGQVRVRRSSKKSSSGCGGGRRRRTTGAPARKPCSCWRVRKSLFSHHFAKRFRPKSLCPVWSKCLWFFRFGFCRKVEIRDDSSKMETNGKEKYKENETEDEEDEAQEELSREAFNSSLPPKNALLLTRCRSAPNRSSSLVSRFVGSPLGTSETEVDNGENREQERPTSECELNCRDSTSESKMDQQNETNLGDSSEFEGSISEKNREISDQEPETGEEGDNARPLILTRCKSEPARTGERLNPEASLWRQTRLGLIN